MTELKRPASVRELVDQLPRPTLIYLCELREQVASRANDDCRSSIARSFRGQRDDFLASLRKDDLVLLLEFPIRDGSSVFELPRPSNYSKRDLLDLALIAFGRSGHVEKPFVRRAGGFSSSPMADAAPLQREEPPASWDSGASAGADVAGGWSRLRPLRALFAQVGLPIPSALGQDEFGALLDALELRGFEVTTADGQRLTALHDAVALDAELRLRHDGLAGPASLRTGVDNGPAPLVSRQAPDLGDYERASLRLELLTAGDESVASAEFVARAVVVATAGLALQSFEHALLERVGGALSRAPRDPFAVLTSLARRLDAEDGEVLLREYAALHPDSSEIHVTLGDHWAALCQSGAPRPS